MAPCKKPCCFRGPGLPRACVGRGPGQLSVDRGERGAVACGAGRVGVPREPRRRRGVDLEREWQRASVLWLQEPGRSEEASVPRVGTTVVPTVPTDWAHSIDRGGAMSLAPFAPPTPGKPSAMRKCASRAAAAAARFTAA